jgi:hypothetical protein
VGDDHELVQGWLANDGVEGEVDLRDIEDDAPRVVVLRCPERDREGDATTQDDGTQAHTQKQVQRANMGICNI